MKDGFCAQGSPPAAASIGVGCTMPEGHAGDHVATTGRRLLTAWTQDGQARYYYSHSTGGTARVAEGATLPADSPYRPLS